MTSDKPRGTRKNLGDFGENVAATHLIRKGYHILERKWRCRAGEIDLIASFQGDLIFVEVRTRRSKQFGTPEESLSQRKQARLITVAQTYLETHEIDEETTPWRIDVIAIDVDSYGRVARLNHIPSAIEQTC